MYSRSDEYFLRAVHHGWLARDGTEAHDRLLHMELAQAYLRLALLSEKNARADLVYETPPASAPVKQQT